MNMIREKNRNEWTGVKRSGKEPMFDKNNDILRHVLRKNNFRLLKYRIMQFISWGTRLRFSSRWRRQLLFSGIWQTILSQICNDVSEKLVTVLWNVGTYRTRLRSVGENGKFPITLVHAINVCEVEEQLPILTLVLGRGEWTASRPGHFIPSTHWTRCCLGLRAGQHVLEERKSFVFAENRKRFLGLPALNLVTVSTEPPQLR
jgi:hypothetical protein